MANANQATIRVNIPNETFVVSALKMKYCRISHRDLTIEDCGFSVFGMQHMVPSGTVVLLNGERVTLLNPITAGAANRAPVALPAAPLAGQPGPLVGQPGGERDRTWIAIIPNGTIIGEKRDDFEPKMIQADFSVVFIPGTQVELSAGQRIRMEHGGRPIVTNLEENTIVQIPQ